MNKLAPFRWMMANGTLITPSAMRTTHIFFSVRMIYNALVPLEYKIEGSIRHLNTTDFPMSYWRLAVHELLKELTSRKVDKWMQEQIEQMRENSKKLATLQITD